MKIIQINSVPYGSTGSIMMNIHKMLEKKGHESYVVWGRGRKAKNNSEIYLKDKIGVYFHVLYSRITGKTGFASKYATKRLIKRIDKINPDVIHLHNIHGYYINIEVLFNYIKSKKVKVIWTLHDCWAFTGHCAYFDMPSCEKWKNNCEKCPLKKQYPKSLLDNSKWCFIRKKELFNNIDDMTIVTPSKWLADIVGNSFLNKYEIKVINNGINTDVFKEISNTKIRDRFNIKDKIVILGVASPWSKRKGLEDFIELSKIIDEKHQILLVGLNKKQIKQLPKNIIGLERTSNIEELVEIYNNADIFLNPTYQDNYPTTNLEALACGLRVITYDTGGSPESAFLDNDDIDIIKKTNDIEVNVENIYKVIQARKK